MAFSLHITSPQGRKRELLRGSADVLEDSYRDRALKPGEFLELCDDSGFTLKARTGQARATFHRGDTHAPE